MIDYLLRKLERFGPVAEDERAFLVRASSRLFNYSPHSVIVEEKSSPSDSCIVVQGFAGRVKFLPDGTRQILAFHIPGDFCDLHSFLLQRMDHGIMALTQCAIAKISHAHINEITERFPRLARALWWDTAVDAAVHREWMISMGRRSA
jgi:CRP-like cAMP-binding protein